MKKRGGAKLTLSILLFVRELRCGITAESELERGPLQLPLLEPTATSLRNAPSLALLQCPEGLLPRVRVRVSQIASLLLPRGGV